MNLTKFIEILKFVFLRDLYYWVITLKNKGIILLSFLALASWASIGNSTVDSASDTSLLGVPQYQNTKPENSKTQA